MGNTSISPIKNKNRAINNRSLNAGVNNDEYNNTQNSIKDGQNLNNYSNKIFHNYNTTNNLDYNENNNKKNTYLYGYRKKSNKRTLSYNKLKRANSKTKSQNKTINNIKKYALLFLPKQLYNEDLNNNNNNDRINKNHNYMKKYKNDDKFYRYGKKSNTIISKDSNNLKPKKKFYDTEIINDRDKINKIINEKNTNSRNKNNKSFKNDKSSQFVLLNNSKNLFKAFQDANTDKNNNHTIIGGNSNIINDIKLTTLNEPNMTDNFTNLNNNLDHYDIDNDNISHNSSIKYNKYNYTHTSFIYNKPQVILDQLKDYIDDDDDNGMIEKNNNFKGTYMTTISTNINNIYSSNIIDNSDYKYIGDILSNNAKEGIGKIIYKNNYVLVSSFNNNIINGPIIISDIQRNIFQGYIKDNAFNGYCLLNFNFNKNILKNKLNLRNNNNNIISNNNNDDEIINIFSNYNNLFDFYLDLSDENYNYSYLETYILNNTINDIGIIKWKNNSSYTGEIKNGVKDGIGIFKWPDGSKYEGEFIQDRMEGWGLIHYLDGNIYKGQILDGLPHGYGEFIWNNENRYIGNYINGQKEGFGIYIMISENLREYISYFGFWKKGKQDGYGIVINNKKIYYVKYKEGKKMKNYKYDFFIAEILPFISKKYKKIFQCESKYLRKIVKNIIYY